MAEQDDCCTGKTKKAVGDDDDYSEESFTDDVGTPDHEKSSASVDSPPKGQSDPSKEVAHNSHHDDGCCGGKKCARDREGVSKVESEAMVNRMAAALRRARSDGLPAALNKKPPISTAMAYLAEANIRKRTLHTGSSSRMPRECSAPGGGIAYPPHTKFLFDYRIRDPNTPEEFMDDTKKYGKRMELYCGKDFQIDFWEYCLQTMCIGEVASFMVPPRRLIAYPAVMKKLRDFMLDKVASAGRQHSCAFMSLQECGAGLGYSDLDDLAASPRMLEFIFDLHSVVLPNEARKDTWIMTPEERSETIPKLRQEGNELYGAGRWFEAAAKYEEALNLIESLALTEKPGEPEFIRLDQSRVSFYINVAQCQFKLKDYYGAIRSASEALSRDADNVKALFRRAMAYSATSDVGPAEKDFRRVQALAPDTMGFTVEHHLTNLEEIKRTCKTQQRRLLAGKVFGRPS